jgi:FkbM family methyltransferase
MGMWRTETMEKWSRRLIDHNSDKTGKLIIFEGSPKNCEILDFEARRRNIKNVIIINKVLWSSRKELTFSIKRDTDANYIKESNVYSKLRDLDAKDFTDEDITVQADTVDSILESLGIEHVDHVHMTIGGSEVEAIRGMQRLFAKKNVRLYCKSILSYKENDIPLYLGINEILAKQGMECHMINKGKGKAGKRIYGFF